MSDQAKSITMEDLNKDICMTMANSLRFPLNEIVAWAIFGDSNFSLPENSLIYSNYADLHIDSTKINPEHLELMSSIEESVIKCIDQNKDSVNFSTIDSSYEGINSILDRFLSAKYQELDSLIHQKNSAFKDSSIRWAVLIIAYREMAIFAFKNGSYYVAMQLNEFCKDCQSQIMFKNIKFIDEHKKKLSDSNRKAANKRWQPRREEKKKRKEQYLQIMKEKGFSTYTDAATYIKQNIETGKKPSFPTVCRLLSEADKGDFS
ncbi:hypothetical protein ACS8FD_04665 [Psychrobacter sp. 1U2]|uniref:hypothetical protein n=1 Tax=Psychrobacter sp. 1U2 TaxID=3453577 RepID=UPI003F45BABF